MSQRTLKALVGATLAAVVAAVLLNASGTWLAERARPRQTRPGTVVHPQRLALLTPAVVEVVFALGAGERVAGVTRFASFPPEARLLPQLGGQEDVSFER